ncbi:hypothetical protein [Mesobacillus harenae]|uniref:hypothetical protein n=1 Tax=Mesobacillus harenae TaxID=2213203 RepID=UPI00158056A5|nr:hypothetical protein [Mesobacillus harenae]
MEALFDNPIIIMIILGIISTIFGRIKGENQEEQKKRGTRPAQPARPVSQPARTEYREVSPAEPSRPQRNPVEETLHTPEKIQNVYEEKRREAEERIKQLNSQAQRIKNSQKRNQPKEESVETFQRERRNAVLHPDKSTLVDGIIWSEVLGPPRAKKPRFPLRHR